MNTTGNKASTLSGTLTEQKYRLAMQSMRQTNWQEGGVRLWSEDGRTLVGKVMNEADARRIVACWNALANLSLTEIERMHTVTLAKATQGKE